MSDQSQRSSFLVSPLVGQKWSKNCLRNLRTAPNIDDAELLLEGGHPEFGLSKKRREKNRQSITISHLKYVNLTTGFSFPWEEKKIWVFYWFLTLNEQIAWYGT